MTVIGEDRVARHLRGVGNRAQNVLPVWPKVGNYLSSRVQRQFLSNGAQFNTPWKPLKPEYRLWKMRNGFGNKTLIMSGEMKRSFTGRPMDIELYSPQSATFGSSNQKAVWQHYGTRRNGKRVIPPRKILVLTREVRADIKDIVGRYILKEGL